MNEQTSTKVSSEQEAYLGVDRRNLLKMTGASVAAFSAMTAFNIPLAKAQDMSNGANNFYTSDQVTLEKVAGSYRRRSRRRGARRAGPRLLSR